GRAHGRPGPARRSAAAAGSRTAGGRCRPGPPGALWPRGSAMSGDRVILAVKFTPAGGPSAIRKAVGGFLRYVQYRDKHPDSEPQTPEAGSVSGLLKYVAYRDRATDQGRLFGPDGEAGDGERRAFATYVADSLAATRPQPDPDGVDRRRAVYRFV